MFMVIRPIRSWKSRYIQLHNERRLHEKFNSLTPKEIGARLFYNAISFYFLPVYMTGAVQNNATKFPFYSKTTVISKYEFILLVISINYREGCHLLQSAHTFVGF